MLLWRAAPAVRVSRGANFLLIFRSFAMSEAAFKEGFINELRSQTTAFSGATNEAILLGCEGNEVREGDDPRGWFFWLAGLKGSIIVQNVDPNSDKPAEVVHLMNVDDAVTIRRGYKFKLPLNLFEKCSQEQQKQCGEELAKAIARNMFDVGIACLYAALTSVGKEDTLDHTSSTLKEDYLYERRDFSSSPHTWLTHSTPYSGLIKQHNHYSYLPKSLFSFKGGGSVECLLAKRIVVRDSEFLLAGDDNYRTIGLYDGGLAAFLDEFNVEMSGDVCRVTWNQSIAVRGFAWKGYADSSYDQLHDPSNWQAKTSDKEQWAGFIIETSAGKDAKDDVPH